jgi:hypothetical protein
MPRVELLLESRLFRQCRLRELVHGDGWVISVTPTSQPGGLTLVGVLGLEHG